jgi:hypothetical protein
VRQLSDEGRVAGSGAEWASASASGNPAYSGSSAARRSDSAEHSTGNGGAACCDTAVRAGATSGDARERRGGWSRRPRHPAAST